MTRLEKCELLRSKGYTYDPITGKIFGVYGKEIISKHIRGYILLENNLFGHHFAFYMVYGNVDFEMLDHINQNKSDNRIINLRIANHTINNGNVLLTSKGYSFDKKNNKWKTQITVNKKYIYLGSFNTEDEARNAYLIAKEKYHII